MTYGIVETPGIKNTGPALSCCDVLCGQKANQNHLHHEPALIRSGPDQQDQISPPGDLYGGYELGVVRAHKRTHALVE